MKDRRNRIDGELEKQFEGLSASQKMVLASIYAGMADQLRKKHAAESLGKWKARPDYRWN